LILLKNPPVEATGVIAASVTLSVGVVMIGVPFDTALRLDDGEV
jgi:hypothetical protein